MDKNAEEIVYRHKNGLYINLTNKCPTNCVFCIKKKWKMRYRGHNLNISKSEPQANNYINAIGKEIKIADFKELVFCGYGEPTMRLAAMLEIAETVKAGKIAGLKNDLKIRLNTNGLGNLVNKQNIVPLLTGTIDSVNISLNTANSEQWLALMNPLEKYRKEGFSNVIEFIGECSLNLQETVITAIDNPAVDIEKLNRLARELGIELKIRPSLDKMEFGLLKDTKCDKSTNGI